MSGQASQIFGRKNTLLRKLRFWFYKRSAWTKIDMLVIILAIVMGIATYVALTQTSPLSDDPDAIIWLLNIDIFLLILLSVLIGRRIFSLWSARKAGGRSSSLQVQLALTFGVLAALPALIMTSFSAAFFYFGIQAWFSDRVSTAIDRSISVAEAYLQEHQQTIRADLLALRSDFDRDPSLYISNQDALKRFMATQSYLRNLPEMVLFEQDGRMLARTELLLNFDLEEMLDVWVPRMDEGEPMILNEPDSQMVSAVVGSRRMQNMYFFASRPVDPEVLNYLNQSRSAVQEYSLLKLRSSEFQISMTFIFITVALLLVLSAIWIGLIIARRLVMPITRLVQATEKVAGGDLAARVDDEKVLNIDEYKKLAQSFNDMTAELSNQQNDLITANRQIDDRRRFTETILAGVSSGIIGLDQSRRITLVNENAERLFETQKDTLLRQKITDIFPELDEIIALSFEKKSGLTQGQFTRKQPIGGKRIFLVRVVLSFLGDEETGAVVTFDDITDLEAAQRKAAWGDVARRVAHEIKNPLTPIQLATERLNRRFAKSLNKNDRTVFHNCTHTIIRHVEDIQTMVNEFSQFARMPQPVMKDVNLAMICREIATFQMQAHEDVNIIYKGPSKVIYLADSQLIRQAITNLVKNAIEAVSDTDQNEDGSAKIHITLSENEDMITLELIDNGPGLSEDMQDKMTEPYVTTKEKGSGLGLAIVKKIFDDHNAVLKIANLSDTQKQNYGYHSGVAVMIQFNKDSNKQVTE